MVFGRRALRRVIAANAAHVQYLLNYVAGLRQAETERIEQHRNLESHRISSQEQSAIDAVNEKLDTELAEARRANHIRVRGLNDEAAAGIKRRKGLRAARNSDFAATLKSLAAEYGWAEREWADPHWRSYSPPQDHALPGTVRAGVHHGPVVGAMPALLPVIGGKNVLIEASGEAMDLALEGMQSIMLRMLASIPPGKLRFVLIDPIGLGSNMAGFLNLPDEMYTGKVWTEPVHIEQRLADLSAHMETVIQTYLLNRFATMEEYNERAGEIAEAYRLLVIANFPAGFNDSAAQRLLSIARNGLRTGVYVLVSIDSTREMPRDFSLTELERTATVIRANSDAESPSFRQVEADSPGAPRDVGQCDLVFDRTPPLELFDAIVASVGEEAEQRKNVQLPYDKVALERERWWQSSTADGISVPIGMEGASEARLFELDSDTPHGLLVGRTGSGKSTLLHVLILRLATTYSPDELDLYLIDFKEGIEFKLYATHELPHARVIAIESEREFGLSVLRKLDCEMQQRGDLFRASGVNDLPAYRARANGARLPRLLLIVDEFHKFFAEDDALAREAARLIDRIVREGRSFGMHILLASQNLTTHGLHGLSPATTDQMAVRIALRCTEADSLKILGNDNPAARMLSRPGEGIYNDANGLVEGNNKFQVVWLANDARAEILDSLRKHAIEREWRPPSRQIIFEGDEPAKLELNETFLQALAEQRPARSIDSKADLRLWIGEPVAIESATTAVLRSSGGGHLMAAGRDEDTAAGICSAAILSAALQRSPAQIAFAVADLSAPDSLARTTFAALAASLPHHVKLLSRRQLIEHLEETAHRLEQHAANPVPIEQAHLLVIFGLHRVRELRSDDLLTPSDAGQWLQALARDGNEIGAHLIAWTDSYVGTERMLPRGVPDQFGIRVGLQMSESESRSMLDTAAASNLGSYRALFADEDVPGEPRKFRPYGVPELGWISDFGSRLKQIYASR